MSHHGKFTVIEKHLKKLPIIGYDTEDDSKGVVLEHAFFSKDGSFYTHSHEEALDYIYAVKEPSIFVCHNLEYDIANLMKHDEYILVDEMTYSSQLLKVTLAGTQHYFINSGCFFPGPLKAMGELVGLKKLTPQDGPEYVTRDAEIVYTFMTRFQDKLVDELKVNLGVTIGQMTMETYRRSFMLDTVQHTWNSPNTLKAYYGGRVEIFYKGALKNIVVSDINSCYPDVMRNRSYPDTSQIEPSSIRTHEYGIGKFKVEVPKDIHIPPLPYRSESGRLFFPVGLFTGWWTYAEVRFAESMGVKIIKEYHGEGTNRGCMPFIKFIDTFYNLRLDAKAILKKDPNDAQAKFDDLFYKLWCNNLYGKWSQHKPGRTLTRDKWSDFKFDKHVKEFGKEFKTCKIGPFYSYEIPKLEPPKTANFMWGVYVTSYARINLLKGILKAHEAGHTVLYCDTDSVMYSKKENVPSPFTLTSKLGDWDEEKFDLGVFVQAKGYLLCNKEEDGTYNIKKVACKGVNTNFAYDFIIEGMARFKKPMRMKEALIRSHAKVNEDKFLEEVGENIWSDVEKEMLSVYIKRKGTKGVTHPVDASEIKSLEQSVLKLEQFDVKGALEEENIIIKRPEIVNHFENTQVPQDLNQRKAPRIYSENTAIPKRVYFIRKETMEGLNKGDTWLTGHVVAERTTTKNKDYWVLYLEVYKNKPCPPNFYKAVYSGFFSSYGLSQDLLQKKVDIILADNYLDNSNPDLEIIISDSQIPLPIEDEISESDLKTLEAMDWSALKNVKN